MKAITIAGGVTRDAELRRTQQGDAVLGFSVAVTEGFGDNKRTLYFDVSLWGKRGETLEQYLTKGARVAVSGDLSTREHNGKTYLTVRADQVTLMGGKRDDDGRPDDRAASSRDRVRSTSPQRPLESGGYSGRGQINDDIPFAPEWR